ncbi:class F sortase [Pseudonocardia oroxyli]|uniref:Sortase family protein n=1 Tax=Pseudonocardia oroxyli TaxID=366584 RepID=A0A1G7Y3I2_PSEOR|nr:class F sortase [Pseudonocardia oroxyli]SDG90560.1 Sortase family protein [Pseudonocardia oroxyli]
MSQLLVHTLRAALALLCAAVLVGCASTPVPGPARPPAGALPSAEQAAVAAPVRVRIPAIGVDSPVVGIGADASGALQPPGDADTTGWFADGPAPGATGPALLAGHVDSRTGPAVFYRLRDLPDGSPVLVDRADGSTVEFHTRRTFQTAKAAFPRDAVYAPTPAPELRLVTCGGTFDRAIGHYRDNLVVEAVAARGGWTIP